MKCESCGAVLGEHEHRCYCGWWVHGNEEYERGFNAAIDKAVEVVESANNFLDALNQDEVWNLSCRQADRKLRAVIEELKKLKENI